MILVTGGTGFVGRALVRYLVEAAHPVRLLIRPSKESPQLPNGIPIEVAITSLEDERGMRAAFDGVDTVYHLAGGEWHGSESQLMRSDVYSVQAVGQAAKAAKIERIFFISHLGADRASAYPVLKAKGIAEEHIRNSGIDYTILRTAILFGTNDHFTSGLAQLLHAMPVFIIPGNGKTALQPLWVEDLATCLTWSLEDNSTRNQVFEIGGPEYLTFAQILELVMQRTGTYRRSIHLAPAYLRPVTRFFKHTFPQMPISNFWLDYLAANRISSLDTVPRVFQLMPSRFAQRLDYLENVNWRSIWWRTLLRRRPKRANH